MLDRLRRAAGEIADGAGDARDLIEDGVRGAPRTDLNAYAASRGLVPSGDRNNSGFGTTQPAALAHRFNVMRGDLPGGEHGVLLHMVIEHSANTPGTWYGKSFSSKRYGEVATFKAPYTCVGIKVPEAVGALFRFQVGRTSERVWADDREDLGPAGYDGWTLSVPPAADRSLLDPLLAGGALGSRLLDAPLGYQVTYSHGQLIVRRQHFLYEDSELDALAHGACEIAATLRREAVARHAPRPFGEELPPPAWTSEPMGGRKIFGKRVFAGAEANEYLEQVIAPGLDVAMKGRAREWCEGYAARRGLAIEDPVAYHRAFPDIPFPGHAYAVFRGPLGKSGVSGRIVAHLERSLPSTWSGSDVALLALAGEPADTPNPEGEQWAEGQLAGRFAVRRGIFAMWIPRRENPKDSEMDALAAMAAGFARGRGYEPA